MKKLLLFTVSTLALIGCSSSSNSDELNALSEIVAELVAELEELNKELTAENNALKSGPTTTTTEPEPATTPSTEPEPAYELDDFNPRCRIVDVDGFDASIMPATGTPEPGGLFWDEVLPIIKRVCQIPNIVGADINELAPIK